MKRSTALLALALAGTAAHAAAPTSGTLSPASPKLTYMAGPFAAANASDVKNPTCDAANPCDDFALTLDVPADHRTLHPRDLLLVSARWAVANMSAYALYIVDASGRVVDWKLTELDPVVVSIPAERGQYTLRLVPQQPSPETIPVTVRLIADQTGARPAGEAPRFIAHAAAPGMGDGSGGGESNIGYNPATGRALMLSYTQIMRATMPERMDPPRPGCCDPSWEDVTHELTNKNTNDPILVTDQSTGRTFVSQLQVGTPGDSIFVYSDSDGGNLVAPSDVDATLCMTAGNSCGATRGDGWTLSPSTMNGGIDHQSVGAGPYAAGGSAGPTGAYPNAVYYCSQSVTAAFCARSDDGGETFVAPSVLVSAADCDGFTPYIHGHVKVAPDGTVYVPLRSCGGVQSVIVSEDNGASWEVRRLAADVLSGDATGGDNDSSLGIARDGTVYYCYPAGDGHPHVAVSKDKGRTWINDRDVGYALGIEHAVFANAVAGDGDRAACAFLGTTTPGAYQTTAFTGLWHVYVAMTYDGGDTWHTVNALPEDPVQGRGGIALGGATAIENRNLLDFNEITLDEKGRVIYAFNDGCLGDCRITGKPGQIAIPTFVNILTDIFVPGAVPGEVVPINIDAKPTMLRQTGGRSLYAAYDALDGDVPKAACLSGGRDASLARLVWKAPDNGGAAIAGYRIYRGTAPGEETLIGSTGPTVYYDDVTANPLVATYHYRVTALNAAGEGVFSNSVQLSIGSVPARPNNPPVAALAASPSSGEPGVTVTLDAAASADPDGDAVTTFLFDFGDGSTPVRQAGSSVSHVYRANGRYLANVQVIDAKANRSQNAGTVEIIVSDAPLQPDAFAFVERTGVATGVYVTSESRALTGFASTLAVSVAANGQYRLNSGAWTSAPGQAAPGDTIAVRHISATSASTATETAVTVGAYSTVFRSVTSAIDRTPNAFGFETQNGVELSTPIDSNVITPAGYNAPASVVAGPGASFRIDGGAWVTSGTINVGQTLQTRHTSGGSNLAYTKTYVKVGGVTGYFTTRTK